MAGKTLSYFNLTGGLNTVQTMATINSTTNRTESPDMVNVEYFKLSGLRTMNGNVALNSDNSIGTSIDFGYEYVQGNNRYMIVADRNTIYEYEPVTDTFTTIHQFPQGALADTYITICGYAGGIVAACPNDQINYLIYYKKGRDENSVGKVTSATGKQLTYTGNNIAALGKGDLITIDDTEYEIDAVDVDNNIITLTTEPSTTYTSVDLYLTNLSKIYCTTQYFNQGSSVVTGTNFVPYLVQSHQGRLWIAAKPDGYDTATVVIYSDLGNIHNAFVGGDDSAYDGGYFEQFWEDSSDITALGTWDKYIVVHKREHTYLINTSASDATTWNVESYSEYTCDNQRGFVKANNGYYVYTTSGGGIYPMIQRTIYSAISQGSEASYKIRDTFQNINLYALDKIFAVYHPIKKYIMFYIPMVGETGSNNCYIYDVQTKSWLHRRVPQNVTTAFEFDNKVYIGTADGKVYEEFRGLDFAGETIKFSWKSPWFMWAGGTNWTTTREIRVKMSQEGTNNFYIRNRRDGDESYKQRTITNTSTKTNNLLWDNGILEGDLDRDNYIDRYPVYSYTGADGLTYYSIDNPIKPTSIIRLASSTITQEQLDKLKYLAGNKLAGELTTRVEVDEDEYWDDVVWGTDAIFAYTWTATEARYKCYKSTVDPNIRIWVDSNNTTQGMINIKQQQNTQYVAFYGVDYNRSPNGNIIATTPQYADIVANGTVQIGIPFWYKNGDTWIKTVQYGSQTLDIQNSNLFIYGTTGTGGYGVGGVYQGYPMVTYSYSLDQYRSFKLNRATRYDTGGTSWVWNGLYTRSGVSINNQFTYNTDTVTYDNITYTRYPAGDEGSKPTGETLTVYSNRETLAVGDKVYTQSDLQTVYGEVEFVDGTNYTINSRIFVPDYGRGISSTPPTYYKVNPNFTFGANGTVVSDKYCNAWYQLPEVADTMADTEKVLTDSKWDESTWVNTGQVTKRFPIDRQYFQTLQLEFCGEVDNQGIELYGFEVDGIQLTEVPW